MKPSLKKLQEKYEERFANTHKKCAIRYIHIVKRSEDSSAVYGKYKTGMHGSRNKVGKMVGQV